MEKLNEVKGKSALIPLEKLIEIIKKDNFLNKVESEYYDNNIEASVNISVTLNSFLSGAAIFKPVFCKIETDKGIFNPEELIILSINNEYYDLENKIYNAKKIKILEKIHDTYTIKNNYNLLLFIKTTYIEEYILRYKKENLKKSEIDKILKPFNYNYNLLFNEVLNYLTLMDFSIYGKYENNINYEKIFKNNKKYMIKYKEIVENFISKELFNIIKDKYLYKKENIDFKNFTFFLYNIVLKEKRVDWEKIIEESKK